MNFKSIFTTILQGGTNGAVQSIAQQAGSNPAGTVSNWQGVGIVALFGALVSVIQLLGSHPAVTAAVPAPAAAVPPVTAAS